MKRTCGSCTLCCTLLPVSEFGKKANTPCALQNAHGCTTYSHRPLSCRLWSCAWLASNAAVARPDAAHYVIDMLPDKVSIAFDGETIDLPAIQVWVDPNFREAHRDKALREYIDNRTVPAIIRFDDGKDSFVLFPPSITGHDWQEHGGTVVDRKTGEIVA